MWRLPSVVDPWSGMESVTGKAYWEKEHQGGVVGFLSSSTCCVVVVLAFRQLGLHGGEEDPIECLRVAAYTVFFWYIM